MYSPNQKKGGPKEVENHMVHMVRVATLATM